MYTMGLRRKCPGPGDQRQQGYVADPDTLEQHVGAVTMQQTLTALRRSFQQIGHVRQPLRLGDR
jgi:hypothetical protein